MIKDGALPSSRTKNFRVQPSYRGNYSVNKDIKQDSKEISATPTNRYFVKRYEIIQKECPVCKIIFRTRLKHRDEKTYCSRKCCNSLPLGNRHSKEAKIKVSLKLRRDKVFIRKICVRCLAQFNTQKRDKKFCSQSCASKTLWQDNEYRTKIVSKIRENVKTGKHQGWQTRNTLSFAEKFFKKVLEENGYTNKFITNFPVKKSVLGVDCSACYFLDFYFPEFKLDLEIDGKQHNLIERKTSDKLRDETLVKNQYVVYRIPWRSLNKECGKIFIKNEIQKLLSFLKHLEYRAKKSSHLTVT